MSLPNTVEFNGKTLQRIDDPDTHEFKYYMSFDDKSKYYYFPHNDGFISLTVDQYYDLLAKNNKARRDGRRMISPQQYYQTFISEPVGGRKKRRSTKSRPRRSTRSRKVTLRRR